MPIFIKTTPRIRLRSFNKESLTFVIDENRTATFHVQTQQVLTNLLSFIREGQSLEILEKQEKTDASLSRLCLFIEQLKKNGLVEYYFNFNASENVVVSPKSLNFKSSTLSPNNMTLKQCPYILSRFAYFRRQDDKMMLECPLAPFRISLNTAFFNRLLPYITGAENLTNYEYKTLQEEKTWRAFISLLIKYKVIHPVQEIETENLQFWEFHDLVFHSSSRRGEFDDNVRFGATYRFQEKLSPPLTFKDIDVNSAFELYKPNLDELAISDSPFSRVLESRRSIRGHSDSKKITLEKLGEFLYRSIGLREVVKMPIQDAIFRPYPAAGAIHEIDFYLVINVCNGIEPGVYYYHPVRHTLCKKNVGMSYIEKIISNAKFGMGVAATAPQIVFVLTSRFKKIAWKYEKMSYRCTLISMGAIFQTMSLVATSMNLASCIVGSGDSSLFAEALNIDSLEEGAIGEFTLGVPSD
ncbi:MAG: SagB family peptide dehydrogenase [Parachlamydiaceae bacterium]|nr:SagB family peptide dehydrogenase [Parachlamydiaceae bacterium]